MKATVTKEVTFDCAHMLSGHAGKCCNLHGHTYKVQVILVGEMQDAPRTSSDMMVMDFSVLKDIMQQVIVQRFDHALICSDESHRNEAENLLLEWALTYGMHVEVLDGRTTSENMAYMFRKDIRRALQHCGVPYEEVHVRVWETPTSFAEV